MEHLTDEFDAWGLVWILFFEVHDKPECAVLERSISGADDNGVPSNDRVRDHCIWLKPSELTRSSHYRRPVRLRRLLEDRFACAGKAEAD